MDTKDNEGDSALHWACFYGFKKSVKKLLKRGADVNARNAIQASPLHSATFGGKSQKLVNVQEIWTV